MEAYVVYVLNIDGHPLMPTKRFGKIRRMLRDGQAKVIRREPFTIKLLYEPKTNVVQDLTLGVDTCLLYTSDAADDSPPV